MNAITKVPESVSSAGYEFSYSAWTAGSYITLCNVPWNSDYRDVVKFDDQAALDSYLTNLSGPTIPIQNMTYLKMGEPVRIDVPYNRANRYNYLRVTNPAMPIDGDLPRTFYYFINQVDMLSPNTTLLSLQLDVWQTFVYETHLGNCYVERGHIGVANERQMEDFGREFLTIPEGLDVGGEYRIMKQYVQQVAHARDYEIGDSNGSYQIMVIASVNLTGDDHGTVDKPNLETGPGSRWENLPNGATVYLFNTFQFTKFMEDFKDKPWVTQGIMSISIVPPLGIYFDGGTQVFCGPNDVFASIPDARSMNRRKIAVAPNWRETPDLLPARYAHLKKFLTYPYTVMELTSYTGTPLMLKPESWADEDAHVMELPHFAPPNPRLAFYPFRYNASGVAAVEDEGGVLNDGGEFLDMTTGIMNFPQFSIVNNGGLAYLAANANNIAYQHQAADWGQQRSMTAAMNQYNQGSSAIDTSQKVNQIGVTAAQQAMTLANDTAASNAVMSGVGSVIGAAGSRNPIGAITGSVGAVANYAIQSNQNMQSTAIANSASIRSNNAQNKNAGFVRDSNRDYAEYAAKGDYEVAIAGVQAKVQDAKLIQPTTSGQVGGDAFLLAQYKWGYDLKLKMLGGAAMRAVGEYWLRYGYQCNQFISMPGDIRVMSNFTYWKLKETYITAANMPEQFKQSMRGIFEKGVTVWRDPAKIGNIDIGDNTPIEGIVL